MKAKKDYCDTCGKWKLTVTFKATITICKKCTEELHTQIKNQLK